jgi:hypothetical protein
MGATLRAHHLDRNPSLSNNRSTLTRGYNYAERFRSGERLSSCLAESTVNAVISKRFAKRQQMQWTKRGAHLLRSRPKRARSTARPASLRAMVSKAGKRQCRRRG